MTKEIRNPKLELRRELEGRFKAGQTCCPSTLRTVAALFLAISLSIQGAADPNEKELISTLQSKASPQQKDAACAVLKRIGTAQSVPALASLLTDEQLSHSARYALESMESEAAGQALIAALDTTSGPTKVGIVNSLGVRREVKAVPALSKIFGATLAAVSDGKNADPQDRNSDSALMVASAKALGDIASATAIRGLETALIQSSGPARLAIADGLLRAAQVLANRNEEPKPFNIYQALWKLPGSNQVRIAAFRGMMLSCGGRVVTLLPEAISSSDPFQRTTALQLVHELPNPKLTRALVNILPRLQPEVQVALLDGLGQRSDTNATPAVLAALRSSSPEVRVAAITALSTLGETSVVAPLVRIAASTTGAEQTAARQTLIELNRGNIAAALIAAQVSDPSSASPEARAEAARALGIRGDKTAVPDLLAAAQGGSDSARQASFEALALLVDDTQLGALVRLVQMAKDENARSQAGAALNGACQRLQAKKGGVEVAPIVEALSTGSPETRIALLPVCSSQMDPRLRKALRENLSNSDPKVRGAAIHALSDTTDPDLLPDLVSVASNTPEESLRTLTIGAIVRLTTQEEKVKIPDPERLAIFKKVLATSLTAPQKRMVLSGLSEIPQPEALQVAAGMIDDNATQNEAARAIAKIAAALPASQSNVAREPLKRAAAATQDSATRQAVKDALNQIEMSSDFVTAWQVSGPYRQQGKDYAALFDIPFAPETSEKGEAKWQPLEPTADLKQPGRMDLLKALGGEQCLAYARTWIQSEKEQPIRVELGSDDGVKVWLNGQLVHANNTARPLQPGSDKFDAKLNAGWNSLLVKVTQNNLGWEFCIRVLGPDGSHVDGLQFDAAGDAKRAEAK